MAGIRMKWKPDVFRELRTLPEVQAALAETAAEWAKGAGEGYTVESGITGGRVRARSAVFTGTFEAMADNAKNHTLVRVLGANSRLGS